FAIAFSIKVQVFEFTAVYNANAKVFSELTTRSGRRDLNGITSCATREVQLRQGHAAAPTPYDRRGVFVVVEHQTEHAVSQTPVRPRGGVTKAESSPLRQAIVGGRFVRDADDLFLVQTRGFREHSDGVFGVVAKDPLGVTELVPVTVAEQNRDIAFFHRGDVVTDFDDFDDAGVAHHDAVFATLGGHVDRF